MLNVWLNWIVNLVKILCQLEFKLKESLIEFIGFLLTQHTFIYIKLSVWNKKVVIIYISKKIIQSFSWTIMFSFSNIYFLCILVILAFYCIQIYYWFNVESQRVVFMLYNEEICVQ